MKVNAMKNDVPSHALPAGRKPWVKPVVRTIRARDAEAGANPVRTEGAFGLGS
jgi:hypothetical protein